MIDDLYLKELIKRYGFDSDKVSEISLRTFMSLSLSITEHDYAVSIDDDTGFVNLTFVSMDNGNMTVLIGDKVIYYSLVEQGISLFKISGTFKFKSDDDLTEFKRVLRLL